MAGTRLLIQSLVLVELIALVIWSVVAGLCRKDDVLCQQRPWELLFPKDPVELPPLSAPTNLPLIQVDKQLHPDTPFQWKPNPNTVIVCSQPESPVVQGQDIWLCPSRETQPRIVNRLSSLVVYSKEKRMEALLKPTAITNPSELRIHLVLEESSQVADVAQEWAQKLDQDVASMNQWPCVNSVSIQMSVVPQQTDKWLVQNESTEEAAPPPLLPKLTLNQVNTILDSVPSADEKDLQLMLYIPATKEVEISIFQVDKHQLLFVGGWDSATFHQWLAGRMGIPIEHLDSDGSFPTWYEAWYWYVVSTSLNNDITKDFSRTQHLLESEIVLQESPTQQGHYQALRQLHQQLLNLLRYKAVESNFPVEHYAAIFAPLLFPLLLPFLTGVVKEYRRFKEKKGSK